MLFFFFISFYACNILYNIIYNAFQPNLSPTHLNLSGVLLYYFLFLFFIFFFPDGRDRKTVLRHRPTEPPPQLYGVFVG